MSLHVLEALGAVIALAFFAAAVWLLRSRNEPERVWLPRSTDESGRVWPLIGLGAYALAGAAVTSYTRAGMGEAHAMSPRYVSVSAFLLVAVVGMLLPRALALRTAAWRAVAAAAVAAFVVLLARSEKLGSTLWRDYDYHRGVAVQGLARNDAATFWESYPDSVRLVQYLDLLRSADDGPLVEK